MSTAGTSVAVGGFAQRTHVAIYCFSKEPNITLSVGVPTSFKYDLNHISILDSISTCFASVLCTGVISLLLTRRKDADWLEACGQLFGNLSSPTVSPSCNHC